MALRPKHTVCQSLNSSNVIELGGATVEPPDSLGGASGPRDDAEAGLGLGGGSSPWTSGWSSPGGPRRGFAASSSNFNLLQKSQTKTK